eukprot:5099855-Amphidinium_carterae.1
MPQGAHLEALLSILEVVLRNMTRVAWCFAQGPGEEHVIDDDSTCAAEAWWAQDAENGRLMFAMTSMLLDAHAA